MTRKQAEAACASCVLHELDIICRIVRFHELNPFNPYSMLFREDFRLLYAIADRMHKELDSKLSEPFDSIPFKSIASISFEPCEK